MVIWNIDALCSNTMWIAYFSSAFFAIRCLQPNRQFGLVQHIDHAALGEGFFTAAKVGVFLAECCQPLPQSGHCRSACGRCPRPHWTGKGSLFHTSLRAYYNGPIVKTTFWNFKRASWNTNTMRLTCCECQWKSDPHDREFLSHFDRKKLRLSFARILEAIWFAIHVKDMGVVGQAIYHSHNQSDILEHLRHLENSRLVVII